jgi:FPC/CPF motif-containing protein YcgG
MSLLDQAAATTRPADAPAYETVREYVTDPADARKRYAVEKNVTTGALVLAVETTARASDASPSPEPKLKRYPLAPVARALALGVID